MNKTIRERFHTELIKLPGRLEKIVAAILFIGVAYGCVQLFLHVIAFADMPLGDYMDDILIVAFNVVIVVEFVRMLIKHSMNTIVEVLIFAIARGLVVGHEKPVYALISIISIAILLASRKFLFCEHDFEEEE